VSFSPDGNQLVVSERATQRLDLYAVGGDRYATGPTVMASVGVTPFGFGFDNKDHLIVPEAFGGAANASVVSSYDVRTGALDTITASAPRPRRRPAGSRTPATVASPTPATPADPLPASRCPRTAR